MIPGIDVRTTSYHQNDVLSNVHLGEREVPLQTREIIATKNHR